MREILAAAFAILGLAACTRSAPPAPARAPDLRTVPGGDVAGGARSLVATTIINPLEGQAKPIADGKRLYVQMNCAGCHGYDLGGSMGPNLKDRYWRYGGTPAEIYRSIASGHPQGMPAWSEALTADQIWGLVAYIQSYGGATPAADYQGGLQGDYAAKTTGPAGGTGAQSGATGGTVPAAQPTNP